MAGVATLASLGTKVDESVEARSYFDPVSVVMQELRVRAEEKERRKISRQKRTEQIFSSVS
jgi:hypothetical protein